MTLPDCPPSPLASTKYGRDLAASITWAASKQTFYTIRFLADRGRVRDAYRAYAYFRWVDDRLDAAPAADRLALSAASHHF
jgi:hypothetical protein